MIYTHFLLSLGWVAFCVFHSVLANIRIKNTIGNKLHLSSRGYRLLYNFLSFVSLGIVFLYHVKTASRFLFRPQFPAIILAIILMLIGLMIMFFCIQKYFVEMSGLFKNAGTTLSTQGLHSRVRHPLYLGTLIFSFSIFLIFPQAKNLVALAIIFFYTRIGIYIEEKKLVEEFGNDYLAYKKDVPMLVPKFFMFKK